MAESLSVTAVVPCAKCGRVREPRNLTRGLCSGCYSALRRRSNWPDLTTSNVTTASKPKHEQVTKDYAYPIENYPAFLGRGSCAGMDTERFFPKNNPVFGELQKLAAPCRKCPVRAECREWAESFPETARSGGIFAGIYYRTSGRRDLLV